MHYQEWGAGDPLIALHPLALESTAFAGVGKELSNLGLRTLAVDLPGFGQTPIGEERLTPAVLAEPVIELARSLERPPILMGMSLGGRVALEVAFQAPEAVRGVVLIAPYLPWLSYRQAVGMARHLNPKWAHHLPLEHMWPVLKQTTRLLESIPSLEHDWFARACVRVAYYLSCPATREAFLSAARELALDPAHGPEGTWTRLAELEMPTVFLWAGRDHLIPATHAADVADVLPTSVHLTAACSGHFVNFAHFRCMERAVRLATARVLDMENGFEVSSAPIYTPCLSGREHLLADEAESHAEPPLRGSAARGSRA